MIRNWTAVLVLISCLLVASTTPARAGWPVDGAPVIQAAGAQSTPALAPDGLGGVWIAWADDRAGGGESDIYARRLAADGSPLGPVTGIPVATAAGRQEAPDIAPDGQGGCIIVWQDRRERLTGSDLFMQRLNAAGAPLWHPGGVALLVTFGDQEAPRIVREQFGSWIVAWQDGRLAGNPNIYAQRILSSGLPFWLASGVPVCRAPGAQLAPRIVADRVGGAVLTWSDRRNGTDYDLYGQLLDYNGAPRWPFDGRILAGGPGDQLAPLPILAPPNLALDAADGAYVAWADTRDGGSEVYLQHIEGDGNPAPGWPAAGLAAATPPLTRDTVGIVADGAGGVLISFRVSAAPGDDRLRVNRVSSTGARLWGAGGVLVTVGAAPRSGPCIAADGHGGAFLNWSESDTTDPGNVLLQWVDAAGQALLTPGGYPFSRAPGGQQAPVSLAGPPSDLFVAWSDMRAGNADLFGQRLSGRLGNLTLATWPAGFEAPLVPRSAAGSLPDVGLLPATLPGNSPTIRFNEAYRVEAVAELPGWRTVISVDGLPLQETVYPAGQGAGDVVRLNGGPYTIRGGRHTLSLALDPDFELPENDEADNLWSVQYVFEPMPLVIGQSERRASPPPPGDGDRPNSDGFRWDPPAGMAWVIGVGAAAPDIEETLLVYDDYTGLTDGFSRLNRVSAEPGDAIEIILGDRTLPSATLYPAISRAEDFTSPAGTLIDCQAAGERLLDRFPFVRGPETLPPDRLVHVYDVFLEGGIDREFLLQRAAGSADLEMALFAPTGQLATLSDAKIVSTPEDPVTDRFHYLPQVSGWYPLAVYRRFAYEADGIDSYRLYGLETQSGAPLLPGFRPLALRLAPNPLARGGRLELDLPEAGPVALKLFDIRGRHLRSLIERTTLGPGTLVLEWDGTDASGRRLPAGRYVLRLDSEGGTRNLPVTLLP